MEKENSKKEPLSCYKLELDEHELSIIIESLQTLLHHRVSCCNSANTATMFRLLSFFKTLSDTELNPF